MAKKETHGKRGGGKVAVIILIALIVVVAITGVKIWLGNTSSLVPDRDPNSGLQASDSRINILIVGTDVNDIVKDKGRADAIMVAGIDLKNKKLSLLSLPRDSYVDIAGYDKDKINHSFAFGGIDCTRETVQNLLNIPIDYYVLTNFAGFQEIVDVLGGVEINVDKRMNYHTYYGTIDLQPGLQTLNGEQALQYVRYRHDALGDVTRVERQRNFITAVLKEAFSAENITKLPEVISKLSNVVDSDLTTSQMVKLGKLVSDMSVNDMDSETAPGDFGSINGISYWMLDKDALSDLVYKMFVADDTQTSDASADQTAGSSSSGQ